MKEFKTIDAMAVHLDASHNHNLYGYAPENSPHVWTGWFIIHYLFFM